MAGGGVQIVNQRRVLRQQPLRAGLVAYSVYDSLDPIRRWANRVILIPTTGDAKSGGWFHPLLTSGGILLCALKD